MSILSVFPSKLLSEGSDHLEEGGLREEEVLLAKYNLRLNCV